MLTCGATNAGDDYWPYEHRLSEFHKQWVHLLDTEHVAAHGVYKDGPHYEVRRHNSKPWHTRLC